MTVDVATFRANFPAFADEDTYAEPSIQFWLDLAYKRHNAERWGDLLDQGIQLYVAHELSVEAASSKGSANSTPGQIIGNITSRSVGGMSYSRDVSSITDSDAGYMNASTYGLRWRNLMKLVGAGPVQVGLPTSGDYVLGPPWGGF